MDDIAELLVGTDSSGALQPEPMDARQKFMELQMLPQPLIQGIDHVVISVSNMVRSCNWYEKMLGVAVHQFESAANPGVKRFALVFGDQKINLHEKAMATTPLAMNPQVGSADLCFWTNVPVEHVLQHWQTHFGAFLRDTDDPRVGRPVVCESNRYIVARTGAHGPLKSVYIYDLDGNLIEVANRE
ncbi:Glyoxalase/Bleomycin resistance protein/Dihydroxybiphenyl dioxygenase [Gongronella butleri]|nr:Glyoxalase/Bleomycin resistance protein/Dihydroxybiphenyl dioxygenase [Gongronella butleri]